MKRRMSIVLSLLLALGLAGGALLLKRRSRQGQ